MYRLFSVLFTLSILLAACSFNQSAQEDISPSKTSQDEIDLVSIEATSEALEQFPVPDLPFPDNADPSQCGIPQAWGSNNNRAWLNGYWDGELIEPTVYLYDSHARNIITAAAPHNTEVQIVLFQSNPTLNFYLVKIPGLPAGLNEGWVPAPFLSFDEPTQSETTS